MTDSDRIQQFLRRARGRALFETGLRTGGYAVAVLVVVFVVLCLSAAKVGPAASWPYVTFGALFGLGAAAFALGFLRPARALEDPAAVARLLYAKNATLSGDVLSAVQLQAASTDETSASAEMRDAFCAQVAAATTPVVVEDLFPLDRAKRAMAIAGGAVLLLLVVGLVFPSPFARGVRTLFRVPTLFEGAMVAREPLVGDVRVTYDFPPYTELPRQTIEGSTGDLHALRGTKVRIEMRPLRSTRQARLLFGDDGDGGALQASLDHGKLSANLTLEESGSYRVWLQPFLGRPTREDRAHRILVESDRAPEVDIVGPADRLEIATPRPIELAYHARDDFGLGDVTLVFRVNGGPEKRIPLKSPQGQREVRATTTFEPPGALLLPGGEVAYHVEATDRDDVSGSKTGVSRTLYLVVQNPRESLDEHLAREHDVLEKLIASLGDRIEVESSPGSEPAQRLGRLRDMHENEQNALAQLSRLLEDQKRASDANKILTASLVAAVARLGKLMHDEKEAVAGLVVKDVRAPNPALWARLRAMAPRHIADLETAVLSLDDLIGRQRLDDLAGIGQELASAHKRLSDLLERYKASGDEQLRRQIEREVRELRERIVELGQKIAEVKARNEVSQDWMNLPDTRRALEKAVRFDSLLAQGDTGSLDQALSELGESLGSLRDMLDSQAEAFSNTRFPQESRALAEMARKIGELEIDQRQLAQDGRGLAKEVDAELARRIEGRQAELIAKSRQKIDQIQRKLGSGIPKELGSGGETSAASARESLRQLRRLLPSKEWSEAAREADRLVGGIGYLQRAASRAIVQGRAPSASLLSFDDQIDEAMAAARELAADLERVVPRGSDVMSPEQRGRTSNLSQRQESIEDRTRGLSRDLGGRGSNAVPGTDEASSELQSIAEQMRQASDDLHQGAAREGAGRAEEAAHRLAQLRQSLGRKPSSGASRASREPVRIPEADASKAPREWRQELMEAMREKAPERYRDEVRRYYEDLVK